MLAPGQTVIKNAAKEPEVIELCLLLNKMGADIHGMGTGNITIYGVSTLHDAVFSLVSDRIVAATYLAAAAATAGDVEVRGVWAHDLKQCFRYLPRWAAVSLSEISGSELSARTC